LTNADVRVMVYFKRTRARGVDTGSRGGSVGEADGDAGRASCKTLERYYASLDAYYRALRLGRQGVSYVGVSSVRGVDVGPGASFPRWYGCGCPCCKAGGLFLSSDGGSFVSGGGGLDFAEGGSGRVRQGLGGSGGEGSSDSECTLLGSVSVVGDAGSLDSAGCGNLQECPGLCGPTGGISSVEAGLLCSGGGSGDTRSGSGAGRGGVGAVVVTEGECAGVGRGANWERNRASREKKKKAKVRKQTAVVDAGVPEWRRKAVSVKTDLQVSLEAKWKAENELAVAKAQRQMALLDSRDLEQEKKVQRTALQKRVEQNMVAIENTHATLRATGNVPGVPPVGFAETVVDSVPGLSSGGCSISPSSSVSEAEVRRLCKELEDCKVALRESQVLLAKVSERCGIEPEFIDEYDKRTWTDNRENGVILDAMYPGGFVKQFDDAPRGKFHLLAY